MTALGVGLDLVDIDRIAAMLDRYGERALRRVLTEPECEYCFGQAVPARHAAARIAAKEAAFKALGSLGNAFHVGWHDVEVVKAESGSPTLRFIGRGKDVLAAAGVATATLSLTHTDRSAAAVVVLTR